MRFPHIGQFPQLLLFALIFKKLARSKQFKCKHDSPRQGHLINVLLIGQTSTTSIEVISAQSSSLFGASDTVKKFTF